MICWINPLQGSVGVHTKFSHFLYEHLFPLLQKVVGYFQDKITVLQDKQEKLKGTCVNFKNKNYRFTLFISRYMFQINSIVVVKVY